MRRFIALVVSMAVPALVNAQTLVIDGGTIHTMKGDAFTGRVVIEKGMITAVGANAVTPADATRIDATGMHVYPGLFDALSTVGLDEVDAVSATNDMSELGMYNPNLAAATAVHPSSEVIPVTRVSGITHVLVAPGTERDGVIAGQAALVNLDGWTEEEMSIDSAAALVIDWPGIVTRRYDQATFSFKETPYNDAKDEATKKQNELRDWIDQLERFWQGRLAALGDYLASLKNSSFLSALMLTNGSTATDFAGLVITAVSAGGLTFCFPLTILAADASALSSICSPALRKPSMKRLPYSGSHHFSTSLRMVSAKSGRGLSRFRRALPAASCSPSCP